MMPNISSLQNRMTNQKGMKSGGGQVQQQRDQTGEQQLGGHARPLPGGHLVILIPTFQTCSFLLILVPTFQTCSYCLLFKRIPTFQTYSYFSNLFLLFKLIPTFQTCSYFSNFFLLFKLVPSFQTCSYLLILVQHLTHLHIRVATHYLGEHSFHNISLSTCSSPWTSWKHLRRSPGSISRSTTLRRSPMTSLSELS